MNDAYQESEASLDKARKDFDIARVVLATVKTFGSADAILAAKQTLQECTNTYIDWMVKHVRKMVDVVREP
jgi:hypothetical protein